AFLPRRDGHLVARRRLLRPRERIGVLVGVLVAALPLLEEGEVLVRRRQRHELRGIRRAAVLLARRLPRRSLAALAALVRRREDRERIVRVERLERSGARRLAPVALSRRRGRRVARVREEA